jgi:hypothetical protein
MATDEFEPFRRLPLTREQDAEIREYIARCKARGEPWDKLQLDSRRGHVVVRDVGGHLTDRSCVEQRPYTSSIQDSLIGLRGEFPSIAVRFAVKALLAPTLKYGELNSFARYIVELATGRMSWPRCSDVAWWPPVANQDCGRRPDAA